jgi:hypothetical protein|tara:strand:- start:1622 stop:2203 length:582 start_codon:yes stop_codon:yes gene_type:complete
MNRKNYKVSTELPELPDLDGDDSILSLFDQTNPDINMFNLVDDEMIRLAGSKMYFYKYYQTEDFDPVYMEARDKPVAKDPIIVHGHYDPISLSEELTQFGIELTNDQLFTFNKSYIERKLHRSVIPGDIIKPQFQNQMYEIFEVVEDGFEAYGVYHLVCSARLLRDAPDVQDTPLLEVSDDLGGYAGGKSDVL